MTVGFPPSVPSLRKAMQVQFFRGADLDKLQQQLNDWLAQHPNREVVAVKQSVGQQILISVWYID